MKKARPITDRLMERVLYTAYGCWEWTGYLNPKGYGHIRVKKKTYLVHRVAYEQFIGPIPGGLEPDHLCRNRCCINPSHLEAVTPEENKRRGVSYHKGLDQCPQGHPYDEENTKIYQGMRYCRACHRSHCREWARRKQVKKKIETAGASPPAHFQ